MYGLRLVLFTTSARGCMMFNCYYDDTVVTVAMFSVNRSSATKWRRSSTEPSD